jgi:hypothetical protein
MALSSFALSVWIQYAVAISWMILRFVVRFTMVGWRNFDGSDVFCVLSAVSEHHQGVCLFVHL